MIKLYFEIIVVSHAVMRSTTEIPGVLLDLPLCTNGDILQNYSVVLAKMLILIQLS